MKKPGKEQRQIEDLMQKINVVCDGYSNKVVISALLSLAAQIIGENNTTTTEAMTMASVCGLRMMDTIRKTRQKIDKATPA